MMIVQRASRSIANNYYPQILSAVKKCPGRTMFNCAHRKPVDTMPVRRHNGNHLTVYTCFSQEYRFYSSSNTPSDPSDAERKLMNILQNHFPQAERVEVEDISGGCGAMYNVNIVSPEFEGISLVKQHQMVTKALKVDIQDMHGIRINTSVPASKNVSS